MTNTGTASSVVYGAYASIGIGADSGSCEITVHGDVTNMGTATGVYGAYAYKSGSGTGSSTITVHGDVTNIGTAASVYGAYAINDGIGTGSSEITVHGDVTNTGTATSVYGAYAYNGTTGGSCEITVHGDVTNTNTGTATSVYGAYADNKTTGGSCEITVHVDVTNTNTGTATSVYGAYAYNNVSGTGISKITVHGDVTNTGTVNGTNPILSGVYALDGGEITVQGNVTNYGEASGTTSAVCSGAYASYTSSGAGISKITVNGDVTNTGTATTRVCGTYAYSSGSGSCEITVQGDVTNTGTATSVDGAYAYNSGSGTGSSRITVQGDVTNTGTATSVYGAYAHNLGIGIGSSEVTIDGSITSPGYIGLGNPLIPKTKEEFEDETTLDGYYTYTNGTSTVWVKVPNELFVLSITPSHAILEKAADTVTFTAVGNEFLTASKIKWSYVPAEAGSNGLSLSSADGSSTTLTLTTVNQPAYFTVTAKYDNGGVEYTATATVEILPGGITATPETTAKLLEDKATVNKARTTGALIPVLITKRAMTLNSAEEKPYAGVITFTVNLSGMNSDKFEATMYNDRYLEIKVKDGVKNGSYKNIEVEINGQPAGKLTLTVTDKAPKITLKSEQLDILGGKPAKVTASSADGNCSITGMTVPSAAIQASGETIIPGASPKTGTYKVTVFTEVDGYTNPVAQTVSVKVVNNTPKLKLSPSTITLAGDAGNAKITLLSSNSKNPLSSYPAVTGATIKSAAMAAAENLTYNTGKITIPGNLTAGKYTIEISFAGTTSTVKLTLTIKKTTMNKVTIAANPKSLVVNTNHEDTIANIVIKPNAANVSRSNWTIVNPSNLPAAMDYEATPDGIRLFVKTGLTPVVTPKAITLEINTSANPFAKPAKVSLKVTGSASSFSMSVKGKLDIVDPESFMTVTAKLSNTTSTINTVQFIGSPGADLFEPYDIDGNTFKIKVKNNQLPCPGASYPIIVKLGLDNGDNSMTKTLNIKPVQGKSKAFQSRKEVNLYRLIPKHRSEYVSFDLLTPANVTLGAVTLEDKTLKGFKFTTDGFELKQNGLNSYALYFKDEKAPVPLKGSLKSSYTVKVELWPEGTFDGFDAVSKRPIPLENGKAKSKPVTIKIKINVK